MLSMDQKFSQDQRISGFIVHMSLAASAIDGWYYELSHPGTGFTVFVAHNSDQDKGFNFAFKTPPVDNTGVTHILEHAVLAGSESYPVRDPFFSYLKASPNTFMNATTYEDMTTYPAASQVEKDFENLFDVYFDAVFFPLLKAETFWQEGHRLEVNQDSGNTTLNRVGVVYNEMKAWYSDIDLFNYMAVRRSTFDQESSYHWEPGGNPDNIPELTHEQLLQYHQQHYHPKNACLSMYGDLDIQKYLDKIDTKLAKYTSSGTRVFPPVPSSVTKKPQLQKYRFQRPAGKPENQASILCINFYLPPVQSVQDILDLHIVQQLLFEDDHSTLKHALDNNNFSTNSWVYSGVDEGYQPLVIAGVNGANDDDATELQDLVTNTINQLLADGIDQQKRQFLFKKISIDQRKARKPRTVTHELNHLWKMGLDPDVIMDSDKVLAELKMRLMKPEYFDNLLNKIFLSGDNYSTTFLEPVDDYHARQGEAYSKEMSSLAKQLSAQDIDLIEKQNKRLLQIQAETADEEITPQITTDDIDTTLQNVDHLRSANLLLPQIKTNKLHHSFITVNLSGISKELIKYVELYAKLIGRTGTSELPTLKMLERIDNEIAQPVTASTKTLGSADGNDYQFLLILKATSLSSDAERLAKIIQEYLYDIDFDSDQVNLVINELSQTAESNALFDGNSTAIISASKHLSQLGAVEDQRAGITSIQNIKQLTDKYRKDPDYVLDKLLKLKSIVAESDVVVIACDSELTSDELSKIYRGLKVDLKEYSTTTNALSATQQDTVYHSSLSQVGYVVQSFPAVGYSHPDAASLRVLQSILRGNYLHQHVREQGGAYGGGARYNTALKTFSMFSYRDPNIANTLEIYEQAIDWFQGGKFSNEDIDNAQCLSLAAFDRPLLPAQLGLRTGLQTLSGLDHQTISQARANIYEVNKDKLLECAAKYLQPQKSTIAVIAGSQMIEYDKPFLNSRNFRIEDI